MYIFHYRNYTNTYMYVHDAWHEVLENPECEYIQVPGGSNKWSPTVQLIVQNNSSYLTIFHHFYFTELFPCNGNFKFCCWKLHCCYCWVANHHLTTKPCIQCYTVFWKSFQAEVLHVQQIIQYVHAMPTFITPFCFSY